MTRRSLLVLSLSAVLASGAAYAAARSVDVGNPDAKRSMQLDKNGDGAIDRSEAAAHPRLAGRFDAIDSNKDGRLAPSEMKQARMHRGGGRRGHGGGGGMARLDKDGDGRISQAEAAGSQRFAGDFTQVDANRDGFVTRGEVRAWHERQRPLREAERNKRLAEKFVAADLNHDGKLSKLEVSEELPRMQKSFAWMDENRDGFLSREELRPRGR